MTIQRCSVHHTRDTFHCGERVLIHSASRQFFHCCTVSMLGMHGHTSGNRLLFDGPIDIGVDVCRQIHKTGSWQPLGSTQPYKILPNIMNWINFDYHGSIGTTSGSCIAPSM